MITGRGKYLILFFALLLLPLSGCKTSRTGMSVTKKQELAQWRKLIEQTNEDRSISASINFSVRRGSQNISSKGNIAIIKDSLIQISITPLLGIEMFKLQITPDSIKYIDRTSRIAIFESIQKAELPRQMEFQILQGLLLNQPFSLEESPIIQIPTKHYVFKQTAENETEVTSTAEHGYKVQFLINKTGEMVRTQISGAMSTTPLMKWDYRDFLPQQGILFPVKQEIEITYEKEQANAQIIFSKINRGKTTIKAFNYPVNYQRIDLKELIKSWIQ